MSKCEYYWFVMVPDVFLDTTDPLDFEELFRREDCTAEAIVSYKPTHPYNSEPQFADAKNVCATHFESMQLQDSIQKALEDGTLDD